MKDTIGLAHTAFHGMLLSKETTGLRIELYRYHKPKARERYGREVFGKA